MAADQPGLQDLYRDKNDDVWEVIGLITDPVVVVKNFRTGIIEHHVIGCRNWNNKWAASYTKTDFPGA